jgi:hypothetical protein
MADLEPMPCADRERLLKAGFNEAIIEELDRRHYRPCQPPERTVTPGLPTRYGFLRQGNLPHLHIALTTDDTIDNLDTAIYEAGRRDGHDFLAGLFVRALDAVRNRPAAPDLSTVLQRLATLESRLPSEP